MSVATVNTCVKFPHVLQKPQAKGAQMDQTTRGSRELWLNAAYEALIDGGVEAVKVLPLAEGLGLSRTSFYWFFADREALLAALADAWDTRNTGAIETAAGAYADSAAEAMLNVIGCFLDPRQFDSRFEFAVRSWSLQSPDLETRLRAADAARMAALAQMLERQGHDPADADVRARAIYLTQIGYISMRVAEPMAERIARVPAYVEIFTGKAPKKREMARFVARLDDAAARR